MVSTGTLPLAERRVTLHQVSWKTYEQLLEALGEHRAARLTYDRGRLEIMVPLEPHEHANSLIGQFIEILTEELNLNLKSMGSTTLNRPDLSAGGEPDKCYYIQNEPLVRGKTVDLSRDPPPDLVVEVDITHTDINKPVLYANLGVPEFWRYDGKTLRIYQLEQEQYREREASPTFPGVRKDSFYQFLEQCRVLGETQAKRNFRAWVREQVQT